MTTTRRSQRLVFLWTIGFALFALLLSANVTHAQWTTDTSTNNIYYNAGNVGIGTTSPGSKLHINSTSSDTNFAGAGFGVLRVQGGTNGYNEFTSLSFDNGTGTAIGKIGVKFTSAGSYLYFGTSNNYGTGITNNGMVLDYSGNVGIGTTSPAQKLHVAGNLLLNQTGALILDNSYTVHGNLSVTTDSSDSMPRPRYEGYYGHRFITWAGEVMRIQQNGNVGIGTASPGAKLSFGTFYDTGGTNPTGHIRLYESGNVVYGFGVQSGILAINANQSGGNIVFNSGTDNSAPSERMRISSGGNVGIGTTSPASRLEVVTGTADPFFFNGSYNKFKSASGWTYLESYHGAEIVIDNSGNYSDRTFTISKGASRINGGSPTPLLTVQENGNVNISGTINAKYQDVAEWVPSSEQLPAGTVVVLDSTKSNQVTSSSVSYDTRVAGVVSEQPGIALGEKSDNKVLVATTGRVKVKVDASKGAIHIGDLLVTSDIPGVAMKSEPVNLGGVQLHRPGTLIGKALEPLQKGRGEILVLLSLQ